MEPLTALSIASSVVRFADFGSRLLSQSVQLYKPPGGAPTENIDVEVVTADLLSLTQILKKTPPQNGTLARPDGAACKRAENDTALEKLRRRCIDIAEDLTSHLEKLKERPRSSTSNLVQTPGQVDKWHKLLGADGSVASEDPRMMHFSAWASFQKAIEAAWSRLESEALAAVLQEIQCEIQFRIVVAFRYGLLVLRGLALAYTKQWCTW